MGRPRRGLQRAPLKLGQGSSGQSVPPFSGEICQYAPYIKFCTHVFCKAVVINPAQGSFASWTTWQCLETLWLLQLRENSEQRLEILLNLL